MLTYDVLLASICCARATPTIATLTAADTIILRMVYRSTVRVRSSLSLFAYVLSVRADIASQKMTLRDKKSQML